MTNPSGEYVRISRGRDKAGHNNQYKSKGKQICQITERAAHGIHNAWEVAQRVGHMFESGEIQISEMKAKVNELLATALPVEG